MQATMIKVTAALAAFIVIASSARGFSAQRAGFGIQTPTGYQVSNVKYWLRGDSTVESIDFELDSAAQVVSARIVTGGAWYRCATKGGLAWECPVPAAAPVPMSDTDTFQVRAS